MNLATIPPEQPFLAALAAHWLARPAVEPLARARGLIVLPTRRAARALQAEFLAQTDGAPTLLPRIAALGGLDEAPLALAGAIGVAPAVDPHVRLAELSRLIIALEGRRGSPATVDRAWLLAADLAALLDEAARAEIDLAARLPDAAAADFATHWQQTIEFLQIVTRAWPDWLRDGGLMDPAARQVALLDAQAAAWTAQPPDAPVILAGMTGAIPAEARLIRVVAGLPTGLVVLPGLDYDMPDAIWNGPKDRSGAGKGLDCGHPQAGLQRLLNAIGATRGDVRVWDHPARIDPARVTAVRRALLPADALSDWRDEPTPALPGVMDLAVPDQQSEAVAIALVLREAIETPHARAALVTPDRDLAVRVAAELLRYGVVVDDSAGEQLHATPPASFLRLIAGAAAGGVAPVPLLALLKHPFAAAGLAPSACRAAARQLELHGLRGPRPAPGIAGLRAALAGKAPRAGDLLDRLTAALAPLLDLMDQPQVAPDRLLAALLEAAEALAATDAETGAVRLWRHEDGAALAELLAGIGAALPSLPPQPPATLPGLLDAVLAGAVVRSRRALRGRAGAEHPRISIWGLLEAQLQSAELLVLGGLTETVWPPAVDPGPWMSRPMRRAVGLPSPEVRIGRMAHDFAQVMCAAPQVVLCAPTRREGAPAVPARWLTRLRALLDGYGLALPRHPAGAWAARIDRPQGAAVPVKPPAPRPPVACRPRRLSVTKIETWLRDPYAIYARYVLGLQALKPIDEPADRADYGTIVHAGLAAFLADHGALWPSDAQARLRHALHDALAAAGLRPALQAWWSPRLDRIADWVAAEETRRRTTAPPVQLRAEVMGEWQVACPAGPFTITGRADRIERRADDTLAILDYKTGTVPTQTDVDAGFAAQLPLEAVMAAAGAFGPDVAHVASELTYWWLSGGFEPGKAQALFKNDAAKVAEAMGTAQTRLRQLMCDFDNPDRAYLSQPHPGAAPRFAEYAQLARVAEWATAEG